MSGHSTSRVTQQRSDRSAKAAALSAQQPNALDSRAAIFLLGGLLFVLACGSESTTITWEDTSENERGFRIYRITNQEKILLTEVGPNITQYTDENAPPDACYLVTAYNDAGESAPTHSVCKSAVD